MILMAMASLPTSTYLSLSISGPLECGVGSYKFILGAQGAPQKIFFGSSLDEQ